MDLDTYQSEAIRTAAMIHGPDVSRLVFALGLCGEAGEAGELVKKNVGHGHEIDRDKLTKELGDVLWYLAALADAYEISLDVIAQRNVTKLRTRYPHGFDAERSKAHVNFTENLDKVITGALGYQATIDKSRAEMSALLDDSRARNGLVAQCPVCLCAAIRVTDHGTGVCSVCGASEIAASREPVKSAEATEAEESAALHKWHAERERERGQCGSDLSGLAAREAYRGC